MRVSDLEVDLLGGAINPNMTMTSAPVTSINTTYIDTPSPVPPQLTIKTETYNRHEVAMATSSLTQSMAPVAMAARPQHPQTLLKQPTIILATPQHHAAPSYAAESILPSITTVAGKHERFVLPKVNIKVEPYDTASDRSSPDHSSECTSSSQNSESAWSDWSECAVSVSTYDESAQVMAYDESAEMIAYDDSCQAIAYDENAQSGQVQGLHGLSDNIILVCWVQGFCAFRFCRDRFFREIF